MRLKKRPRQPKREQRTEQFCLYNYYNLGQIVETIQAKHQVPLSEVTVNYSYDDAWFEVTYEEYDEEYQGRVRLYEKRLATYNKWYALNKPAVDKEVAHRLRIKHDKAYSRLAKLQRQKAKIDKELAEINEAGSHSV